MTRYASRSLTEQDLDERAQLIGTEAQSRADQATRDAKEAAQILAMAASHNGTGCMESHLFPEMAVPADPDAPRERDWLDNIWDAIKGAWRFEL